jgi:hypothetical protein
MAGYIGIPFVLLQLDSGFIHWRYDLKYGIWTLTANCHELELAGAVDTPSPHVR